MHRLIPFFGALLVAGLFGGCASWRWTHSDFTTEHWNKDSYECERDVRQSTFASHMEDRRAFWERCMFARGWRKVSGENQDRLGGAPDPDTLVINW